MTFYVGQKVVCVDDRPMQGYGRWDTPIHRDTIYTIAAFRFALGFQCVDLVEKVRRSGLPYCVSRFRPVVERKTDISCFTAMLTPSDPRKVSA